MKYFRCERGLAMIETVLATTMIAILASIALPRVSRMLDNVCLDYEIRCLHSMMHYTQSVSRISQYSTFKFETPSGYGNNIIECIVFSSGSPVQYCVRKAVTPLTKLKEYHYVERGLTLTNPLRDGHFAFNLRGEMSQSATLSMSKGTLRRYLVLTNYGRIRISNKSS